VKCCILILLLAVTIAAGADDKPKIKYPEHGTVTSVHTEWFRSYWRGLGQWPVYALLTDTKEYEIYGPDLAVGSEVSFRRDKSTLFILDGKRERKYSIYAERLMK
jgi:hypothetical protein